MGFRLPESRQCYWSRSFRGHGVGICRHVGRSGKGRRNRICWDIHCGPEARCKVGVPIPCSSCKEDLAAKVAWLFAHVESLDDFIYNPKVRTAKAPKKKDGMAPSHETPCINYIIWLHGVLNILICFNHRKIHNRDSVCKVHVCIERL